MALPHLNHLHLQRPCHRCLRLSFHNRLSFMGFLVPLSILSILATKNLHQ